MKKLFLSLVILTAFIGCAGDSGSWSPIVDKEENVDIGYKITSPELRDTAGNVTTLKEETIVTELPKEIPEGATIEKATKRVMVKVVNPMWQMGIDGAKDVNGVANLTPFAPLVNLGLMGLSAVLGGIAAFENKKKKDFKAVSEVLVDTIETIGPATNSVLKQMANKKATSAKVEHVLNSVVNDRTV